LLEETLIENAALQGKYLMQQLRQLQQRYVCMGDVRGKGLMVGVELVKDRDTKAPARKWRGKIIQRAFEKGLLILGCGENSIRFCPALTVTRREIDQCVALFEEAVSDVAA
jgi:4-aminobutyrate aminotransferase